MPPSAGDEKNRNYFPALVLVLAFLNFSTTIGFKLLWDDIFLISRINDVAAQEGVLGLLTAKFLLVGGSHYYRPVVLLSLWFNIALAGWAGWFAHLTNVLLHCTVTLLAYLFLVKIASSNRAAMIGALIFALHPAHVETVAFVSGRTDLLAGIFLFPSALFWYKFVKSGGGRHCLLSLAFFVLAVLSKEVAFFLPPFLLLHWALERRSRPAMRKDLQPLLWSLSGWALCLGLVLYLRTSVVGLEKRAFLPVMQGVEMWPGVWSHYFRVLVLPRKLNPAYAPGGLGTTLESLACLLVVLAMLGFLVYKRRTLPALLGFGWIVSFLAPVGIVFPADGILFAERFLYLPALGFGLLLGELLDLAHDRFTRKAVLAVTVTILALYMAGTMSESRYWKNEKVLFERMTEVSPDSYIGHSTIAVIYKRDGEIEKAVKAYERAIELDTPAVDCYRDLGRIYIDRGEFDKALVVYNKAIKRWPDNDEFWYGVGRLFWMRRDYGKAKQSFERALSLNPTNAPAQNDLGTYHVYTGNLSAALGCFERAVAIAPDEVQYRENLAACLGYLGPTGRTPERTGHLERFDPRATLRARTQPGLAR